MNIFFLDKDPEIAATYYCNKHCVKIILETCQMLEHKTWLNHPMTRWVNRTGGNYYWTCIHAAYLADEYLYRYGRHHAWSNKIEKLIEEFGKPEILLTFNHHPCACPQMQLFKWTILGKLLLNPTATITSSTSSEC